MGEGELFCRKGSGGRGGGRRGRLGGSGEGTEVGVSMREAGVGDALSIPTFLVGVLYGQSNSSICTWEMNYSSILTTACSMVRRVPISKEKK